MSKKQQTVKGFDELNHWKDARDESATSRFTKNRKPLTDKHKQYVTNIKNSDVSIVIGPAGSLKTFLACQEAAEMLIAGKIEKIVLSRPLLECDEQIGTLPGDLLEKVSPFIVPLIENLKENMPGDKYKSFFDNGKIEIEPLGLMRGKTYHNCFVILDEAQNATYNQLKLFLSRPGHNCKLVINGDIDQCDLKYDSPLVDIIKRLSIQPRNPNISFTKFGEAEVVRSEIVRFITTRLSNHFWDNQCSIEKESLERVESNLKFYKK